MALAGAASQRTMQDEQAAEEKPSTKRRRIAAPSGSAPAKSFARGEGISTKLIADKKLKGKVKRAEQVTDAAVRGAKKVYEWLKPSEAGELEAEGAEQTWQFRQRDIVQAVESRAASKAFDVHLPQLGPYRIAFARSGRWLVMGGERGHLALTDWSRMYSACEVQVRETTRDVCVLHNEQFFAAAQKKYVYIYDRRGLEVHCCKEHADPTALDFLPHHFLLVSTGLNGVLTYQDTTHGAIVAQHRPRLGPCSVMRQNPWNAVVCLGHANGRVTMWTPNVTDPVVSMQAHLGPVRCLAVDPGGTYLATAGADKQVHVWDLRKTYKCLHSYFAYAPPSALDISQSGMLAVGYGSQVHVWQDALAHKQKAAYMHHRLDGRAVASLRFCPYEDVLAIGHAEGLSTILVPGAGEPNFDSLVADPYQTAKQRQEQEVHQLLDKLQPEMITLDPSSVAKVTKVPKEVQRERALEAKAANAERLRDAQAKSAAKTRMKGKNRATNRHRKRQDNIIEERKGDVKERMREQKVYQDGQRQKREEAAAVLEEKLKKVPRALHRLHKRGRDL